jgi:hypothetical protein
MNPMSLYLNLALSRTTTINIKIIKIFIYLFRMKTTEVADVVYVNNVLTVGCERVGGQAKGGQLLADQVQGWMGIQHHEPKSWFSK